jgi:hypothetical protein
MKKTNSEILNEVKKTIIPKSTNKTQKNADKEQDKPIQSSQDFLQKIISEWIDNNAERITKEIVKDHVKKLFK